MLYRTSKRLLDISIAVILWIVFSPLMFLISILIILSSKGPVFVSDSKRISHFKPFFMYKFRTMKINNEEILKENSGLQVILDNNNKIPLNMDIRVTWLGKLLRKTDLDEIPQVINIILGNMSLVGPRPYMKWEVEKILRGDDPIAKENIRLIQTVKPGITGLWQISGRNSVKFKQRLELGAMYTRNRSIWLDFKILFKTPKVLFTGKGRI
ncbi:sugar transferase [bacterium]|nr:sugar transferase [bacterium]